MNKIAKTLTVSGMLATVAWFFWNPNGWVFQWEPVVVFLFTLAGFVATEIKYSSNPEPHPNDVALLRKFMRLLPSHGVIEFLHRHDFLEDFELEAVRPLRDFLHQWNNAEHEFQNPKLEKLRKQIMQSAKALNESIAKYTSPNRSGMQAVRVDGLKHVEEHERRFRLEAEIISTAANEVVKKHQELVRIGRYLCNLE